MSATQKRSAVMGTLSDLLAQVQQLKTAEEAHSEPGSIGGETEHPIKKVDDNSEDAEEGSRSAENTKDVKEDQGPMGVESASKEAGKAKPAAKAAAKKVAEQEETNADPVFGPLDGGKSTGKDPSVETSSVKGNKEDGSIGGKTTHPATTEDGKKYGSVSEQLADYCKQADALGQSILSAILKSSQSNGATPPAATKKEAAGGKKEAEGTKEAAEAPETKEEIEKAAKAGYDLAGIFVDLDVPTVDKMACDQVVINRVKHASHYGLKMAEALREYYTGFFAQKQAEEEGEPPAEHREEEEESSESNGESEGNGGGSPNGDAGGTPPLGDQAMPSEEELLAMLGGMGGGGDAGAGGLMAGGGGDAGAGGLPGAGGGGGAGGGDLAALLGGGGGGGAPPGGDPMAAMGGGGMPPGAGGGLPPGAGGGMPPGAGGGMPPGAGGGGPGDEAMLMQLIQELGIDPAALEAKAAAVIRQKRAAAAKSKPLDKQATQRKAAMKKMLLDLVGSGK